MKEIIEAIIAASMGSDIINKAKKEFHIRFINGELNKELLKDIESINVKSLNQLLEDIIDGKYSIEASKAPIYSVFYCSENHLVFLDKNDKLRKSFNGNAKTLYSGNSKDEARRICESFLKDCPDFYCVDYTKIYNK